MIPRVKDQLSSPTKSRGSEPLPVRALVLELAPGFRVSDGGPKSGGILQAKALECWKMLEMCLMNLDDDSLHTAVVLQLPVVRFFFRSAFPWDPTCGRHCLYRRRVHVFWFGTSGRDGHGLTAKHMCCSAEIGRSDGKKHGMVQGGAPLVFYIGL